MKPLKSSTRLAVLLVHGMGRSPISMAWLGWSLRRAGAQPRFFGYVAAVESVDRMVGRLRRRLMLMAGAPYIVVGHSLGGVLLRAAVASLPSGVRRPEQMILLASPMHASRMAKIFARNPLYRAATGEAGQLLASDVRMASIPGPPRPFSVIVGTRGLPPAWGPFGSEPNDGIVALSEATLDGSDTLLRVPRMHTLLMNAPEVRAHIAELIARGE